MRYDLVILKGGSQVFPESCINNSERIKEKREDAITQAFYVSIV